MNPFTTNAYIDARKTAKPSRFILGRTHIRCYLQPYEARHRIYSAYGAGAVPHCWGNYITHSFPLALHTREG